MSAGWNHALLEPVSEDQPCGENLDETPLFASLDALRLFGQTRSPDTPPEPHESRKLPEWPQVRSAALEGLEKTRDIRLLAYLAAALLRTDSLSEFCATLTVAASWLDSYWSTVYPRIIEDAIERKNALNCLADPMAVVDRVRRIPLVRSRLHGRFSLRDIDIATGLAVPGPNDVKTDAAQINAAFADLPADDLNELCQFVVDGKAALERIDKRMRAEGGAEVTPSFDPLSAQLVKAAKVLQAQLALRAPADLPAVTDSTVAPSATGKAVAVGSITSHEDAIKALDGVAEFFRRNEPSSPVPMFIERAKRLVSKSFFEVLADIAPDALDAARAAGGVKNED